MLPNATAASRIATVTLVVRSSLPSTYSATSLLRSSTTTLTCVHACTRTVAVDSSVVTVRTGTCGWWLPLGDVCNRGEHSVSTCHQSKNQHET